MLERETIMSGKEGGTDETFVLDGVSYSASVYHCVGELDWARRLLSLLPRILPRIPTGSYQVCLNGQVSRKYNSKQLKLLRQT